MEIPTMARSDAIGLESTLTEMLERESEDGVLEPAFIDSHVPDIVAWYVAYST